MFIKFLSSAEVWDDWDWNISKIYCKILCVGAEIRLFASLGTVFIQKWCNRMSIVYAWYMTEYKEELFCVP